MAQDSNGNAPDGGRLGGFERNLYFHGKLMTARDMEVEQHYHAGRLDAVAREVLGEGIVTGLQAEVAEKSGELEVCVDRGLALDSYGRLVLVEDDDDETIDAADYYDDGISIFLHYDDCKRETVPAANGGDACSQECCYNRVREGYQLSYSPGPPEDGTKPVEGVVFPSPDEGELDETDRPGPEAVGLHEVAEDYNGSDAGSPEWSAKSESGAIFLGYFERPESDDTEWKRREDEEPRPYVYTNDLLYAAVSRHAADFNNPHEVTAEQLDAIVSVDGVESPGGNVDLHSADGTITIDRAEEKDEPHVDFALEQGLHDDIIAHGETLDEHDTELGNHQEELNAHESELNAHESELSEHHDWLEDHDGQLDEHGTQLDEQGTEIDEHHDWLEDHEARLEDPQVDLSEIEKRLEAHERRLFYHTWLELERTLKYQVESFYDVIRTFPETEAAVRAAELTQYSAETIRNMSVSLEEDNAYRMQQYVSFLDGATDLALAVREALHAQNNVDGGPLKRYEVAVMRLRNHLDEPPEGVTREEPTVEYVLQLLVLQASVCEAARLLATLEEEPIQLPGGFELPRGLVNRPLRTGLELREPTGEDTDTGTNDPVLDPPIVDIPTDFDVDRPRIDPEMPFDRPDYSDITLPTPEEPTPEEPTTDGPTTDGPTPDDPVVTDPVIDNPVIDNPVIDNPVIDNPVTDPVRDGPIVDRRRRRRDLDGRVDTTPDQPADTTPDQPADTTPDDTVDVTPDDRVDVTPDQPVIDQPADTTPDEPVDTTPDESVDVTPDDTVDVTPDDTVDVMPDQPVLDTVDEPVQPIADIPTLTDTMPDLTGEPVENVSRLTPEEDTRVEFKTPDGETVDPEKKTDHVIVDQPTEPGQFDRLSSLTFTVAEPQSTDLLSGVGPKRSEELADAGYPSVEALSKADPEKLADALTRVSVSMAEEWIAQAREHVKSQR